MLRLTEGAEGGFPRCRKATTSVTGPCFPFPRCRRLCGGAGARNWRCAGVPIACTKLVLLPPQFPAPRSGRGLAIKK